MMPITYTTRKGRVYFLCVSLTSTGKSRYNFSVEPRESPVEEIPEGFEIQESVNGVVSLVRTKPSPIAPEDAAMVAAALNAHPETSRYRITVKSKTITVFESEGPDRKEIRAIADYLGIGQQLEIISEIESIDNRQFRPILRFSLINQARRIYMVERWCFRGSIDDWIYVAGNKRIKTLVAKTIPTLGTEDFFEL